MYGEKNYREASGHVTRGKQDRSGLIVFRAKALSGATAHFDRIPARGISPRCQAPKSWVQYVPDGPPPA